MADKNAVMMLFTKDDCGAFCNVHLHVIETGEIRIGRGEFLRRAHLPMPIECAMCKAMEDADHAKK